MRLLDNYGAKIIGEGLSYYRDGFEWQVMYLFELWVDAEIKFSLVITQIMLWVLMIGVVIEFSPLMLLGIVAIIALGLGGFWRPSKVIDGFMDNYIREDGFYSEEHRLFDEKTKGKIVWDYDTNYVIAKTTNKKWKFFMWLTNKLYGSQYSIYEWLKK